MKILKGNHIDLRRATLKGESVLMHKDGKIYPCKLMVLDMNEYISLWSGDEEIAIYLFRFDLFLSLVWEKS